MATTSQEDIQSAAGVEFRVLGASLLRKERSKASESPEAPQKEPERSSLSDTRPGSAPRVPLTLTPFRAPGADADACDAGAGEPD